LAEGLRFSEPDDQMRRGVYLAHAWVELVRLGAALPGGGARHLSGLIVEAERDVSALLSDEDVA